MKSINTISEAKLVFRDCTREELVDHAFGDAEVYWYDREHNEVAVGYFGNSDEGVDFFDGSSFSGNASCELRYCGDLKRADRNDSQALTDSY